MPHDKHIRQSVQTVPQNFGQPSHTTHTQLTSGAPAIMREKAALPARRLRVVDDDEPRAPPAQFDNPNRGPPPAPASTQLVVQVCRVETTRGTLIVTKLLPRQAHMSPTAAKRRRDTRREKPMVIKSIYNIQCISRNPRSTFTSPPRFWKMIIHKIRAPLTVVCIAPLLLTARHVLCGRRCIRHTYIPSHTAHHKPESTAAEKII